MSTTNGATDTCVPEGQSILARCSARARARARANARARVATALTAFLSALGLAASLVTFAGVAGAGMAISASSTGNPDVFDAIGSSFTPGGNVHVEVDYNGSVVYSTTVATSKPSSLFVCIYGLKPSCHWVTIPGGRFSTTVNDEESGCVNPNGPAPVYVIKATDLSTGYAATTQVTGYGCIQQS